MIDSKNLKIHFSVEFYKLIKYANYITFYSVSVWFIKLIYSN